MISKDQVNENMLVVRCCANFDAEKCKCPKCGAPLHRNIRVGTKTQLVCSKPCGWSKPCSSEGNTFPPLTPASKNSV